MENCYRQIHFLKEAVTKMKLLRRKLKKFIYGKLPGFAGSFPYYGAKVYFPLGSHIFDLACEQGVYEHENVLLLLSLVKPKTYIFDVGANIGLMSIPLLHSCPDCAVISFEPSPNALPYLLRTAKESKYGDRWTIVGKATGDKIGETKFHIASPEKGAYDGINATKRVETEKGIVVPMTTIDTEWDMLGKPAVSVIKIDVEGAELLTLHGGRDCIATERPFILIEWNAANLRAYNCSPEKLIEFVESIRYRVFSVPSLIPVTDRIQLKTQMLRTENFLLVTE
jgi:FkbM family methyltransferase